MINPDIRTQDNILVIDDVSKIYGPIKALQNVSLSVRPGEWLAIMGPSGSGKTTLMNIIGCLDSPTTGCVTLDGLGLDSLTAAELTTIRRESIGLIFQQFHLVSYLTALENVMVAQYYHSLVDEAEALEALENVGLADRARHLPRQLSGGEQQRVCIARALINHPKLLLADEPTGNLDETNEAMVMDILHSLHRQGSTIIVVTHAQEVAAHADRTVVLEHGRVASDTGSQHNFSQSRP
jgi:putative ABC transport system ATP-binding protein